MERHVTAAARRPFAKVAGPEQEYLEQSFVRQGLSPRIVRFARSKRIEKGKSAKHFAPSEVRMVYHLHRCYSLTSLAHRVPLFGTHPPCTFASQGLDAVPILPPCIVVCSYVLDSKKDLIFARQN